ncbi:MAG: HAMP domain-containing protein [Hydrogenophaga sp.]|uniref:ATP-binding protein n=1 Tax=Hydrogenophaga sp. TaxID=1904254 RepID=UPI001DDD2FEA|nr:ATP-binding protein [Hydrogenophaga sp.]MBX3608359.1 HAMP domain-containing protein [Hydrogenophaga sp.]
MKAWPASLFGRNLLLIVALVVLGQVVGALLVTQLLLKPRLERTADIAAGQVSALRDGLRALPPAERDAFVAAFNRRIAQERTQDPTRWPRVLAPVQRRFIREVSTRLAQDGTSLVWRSEDGSPLALRLIVDGHEHWVSVPNLFTAREFSGAWIAASLAAGLIAALGAWFIQRRINRPLVALVAAARALGRGEPAPRLPEDGPSEIATVSASFNQMSDDLARQDQQRAVMLAGISHDLRTPLTKLRLSVDIAGDRLEPALAEGMVRHIETMDALVGQFLDFARAGDAQALDPLVPDSDANALARAAAEASAAQGLPVDFEAGELPRLPLRPLALRRALDNLIANAHRHGAAPVVLRTSADAQALRLSVEDHGTGIAPAERERLRQPFQRAGASRTGAPGTGLGLAIAERMARAHGGQLLLDNAAHGGLVATLVLPRSAAPNATT